MYELIVIAIASAGSWLIVRGEALNAKNYGQSIVVNWTPKGARK